MPRVAVAQTNFSTGEIAPTLKGRTELDRYKSGLDTCLNWIPTVQGGLTRRPGTAFVAATKFAATYTRLVAFEFSTVQAYVIEFGDQYLRFYRNQAQILLAGVPYEISTPYVAADLALLKFVQSADTLTITHPLYPPMNLTRTDHTAWTLTQIAFIDGPFLAELGHFAVTPAGTTGLVNLTSTAPIFLSTDALKGGRLVRIQQGNQVGYATITSVTNSVACTINIDPLFPLLNTSSTTHFRMGLWSVTTGYPRCSTFHEGRQWYAGADIAPQRVDGSVTDDFTRMSETNTGLGVGDDNAVSFEINTNDVNVIQSLVSDEEGLIVLTSGGEHVVRSNSSDGSGITPTSITSKQQSAYGSDTPQAVRAGDSVLFLQRFGRKIRECRFDFYTNGFRSDDLSILANHITLNGVREMAFQKEKVPLLWLIMQDGRPASLTYQRDRSGQTLTVGWAKHQFGGRTTLSGEPAKAKSVACIPSAFSPYNEAWFIVSRFINGSLVQYVEFLTDIWETGFDRDTAFFVDAGIQRSDTKVVSNVSLVNPLRLTATAHGCSTGDTISVDGVLGTVELNHRRFTVTVVDASTVSLDGIDGTAGFSAYGGNGRLIRHGASFSGFAHLAGEPIALWGDSAPATATVDLTGTFVPPNSGTVGFLTAGLPYNSDARTLRQDAGAADGTAQAKLKQINKMGFLVDQTALLKAGMKFSKLFLVQLPSTSTPLGFGADLFDGILTVKTEGSPDVDSQVCLRIDTPAPAGILGVYPRMYTEDAA